MESSKQSSESKELRDLDMEKGGGGALRGKKWRSGEREETLEAGRHREI